jgi:hypothetical protein
VLAWDGCVNVRDLGRLPTEDGLETRCRVVVRADSIRGLTETGWQAVVDYGVIAAIDLRADVEVAEDPSSDAPIPVTRVPIVPWQIAAGHDWPSMREGYAAVLDRFRPQFARAVSEVAAADGAVVIHCQGGRDRTGLVVALILRLAGVDPEVIAEDHAWSDEFWAPLIEDWFATAPTEEERERRRRVAAPAGRTMVDVLGDLEALHGSTRKFLAGGGAADADLDKIRSRLRGEAP